MTSLPHLFLPSPNVEPRKNGLKPSILLLHYTGMPSAQKACHWLCTPESKVSCHYLVDEHGEIVQMVDEGLRAWHAGESSWRGADDINSMSIGVEIQNTGHSGSYEDFPNAQMMSVIALCKDIVERHSIRPERVLAHSDVAPIRKIDPGEKFDWERLYRNDIGHWVEPVAITDGPALQIGDSGEKVMALQSMMTLYGYGVTVSGEFDQLTKGVVAAFQRHFRPARVDGIADLSTVETLFRLTAALPLAIHDKA